MKTPALPPCLLLAAIIAASLLCPAAAHAACTLSPRLPSAGSTQIESPTFTWAASPECQRFRVRFSPSGTFAHDVTSSPWSRRKSYSMSEASWNALQDGAWAAGVTWRVVGVDAAGRVASSARTLIMDPDLDDDSVSVGGGDCNDADAGVHPGASEVPYDGVDNDCDPLTIDDDLDGDGLVLADDCDDTDPTRGAPEVRSGRVILSTDADVGAFCAGACAVSQLGSVEVGSLVTDLSGMSCLYDVTDLHVLDNLILTNLAGFGALTSVRGDLSIESDNALTSLSGLDGLTSVGGDISISSNAHLIQLTGLDALTSVGGDLTVDYNARLTGMTGLGSLTSVGDYLYLDSNDALASLTGLDGVTFVGGELYICYNPLTSLTGLEALTSVGGGLHICRSPVLHSLNGLENLTSVGGDLAVAVNPKLASLAALGALTSVGGDLWIGENSPLSSLSGFDSLTSVGGDLHIYRNALNSLSGLDALTSIGHELTLEENRNLTDVTSLYALTSVGSNVWIFDNTSLLTADANALVAEIDVIGGGVTVSGNAP